MSKLWVFGDSFTAGCGCLPGDEFYETYPELKAKIWPDLLGDYLEVNEVLNYGVPSASNLVILYTFSKLIRSISRKDYVVIGSSDPTRLGFYVDHADYPKSLSVGGTLQEYTDGTYSKIMSKEEFYSVREYAKYSHIANESKWEQHYDALFSNLLFTLNRIGVNTYYWTYKQWTKHSQINLFTEGKVSDRHWSWAGHLSFFNEIKNELDDRRTNI